MLNCKVIIKILQKIQVATIHNHAVKWKNSFQMIEHFLNTALHLAKHNLEKGPKKCAKCLSIRNPQECLGLWKSWHSYDKNLTTHMIIYMTWKTQVAGYYLTVIFHYIFNNDTKCDVQSIQVILPGPSSTERGFPVLRTGSPTVTPAVNIIRQGIKITAAASFP